MGPAGQGGAARGGAGPSRAEPSRAEHWGWGTMPGAEWVNVPRRFQKVRGWLQWNGPR